MNTYYLHNGIESSGPFTIAELKHKNLTPTTPVWCQGMPDWKTVAEVEELNILLTVVPPPLKIKEISVPTIQNSQTELAVTKKIIEEKAIEEKPTKKTKILGLQKGVFFLISILALLVIASLFMSYYQKGRKAELELKNKQTEKNNIQYRLQQKEIEEKQIQLAIQEKIEADRLLNEKKEKLKNKLFSNQELLITANTSFENAKNTLADASDFQFFRSSEERTQQINQAQQEVMYWKKEIEKIGTENEQLKLELEKIK